MSVIDTKPYTGPTPGARTGFWNSMAQEPKGLNAIKSGAMIAASFTVAVVVFLAAAVVCLPVTIGQALRRFFKGPRLA